MDNANSELERGDENQFAILFENRLPLGSLTSSAFTQNF